MSDIELVIKLSEEEYKYIKGMQFCILGIRGGKGLLNRILNAIRTGMPLPKGYGRLIDADKLLGTWYDNFCEFMTQTELDSMNNIIKNAPTIIEADKTESEEEDGNGD